MSVEIILVDGQRKLLRARRGGRVREVMTEESISLGEISAMIVDRLRPTFESLSVHYFNPPPPRKGHKVGERMEPAISHPTLSLLPKKVNLPTSFHGGPFSPSDPSIGRVSRPIDAVCPGLALLFETAAQLWFLLKARQYNFRREPPRARREGTSSVSIVSLNQFISFANGLSIKPDWIHSCIHNT